MAPPDNLKLILEAALLAAGRPLTIDMMLSLFTEDEQPGRNGVREALQALSADYAGRGIELREVSSGWRIQVGQHMAPWVSRMWEEKPSRYSRATMETLALIAYRQPITRGEIEDVRGVSVATNIVKTLLEREWIRVVGHRDVPGKPALYATTREFLDYFNLKSLDDLPTLAEIRDLDEINRELDLGDDVGAPGTASAAAAAPDVDQANDVLSDGPAGNSGADTPAVSDAAGADVEDVIAADEITHAAADGEDNPAEAEAEAFNDASDRR